MTLNLWEMANLQMEFQLPIPCADDTLIKCYTVDGCEEIMKNHWVHDVTYIDAKREVIRTR